jgi:hypothetical protein
MLRLLAPRAWQRLDLVATGVALILASSLVGCSDDAPSCPSRSPAILSFTVAPTSAAPGETLAATLVVENFELGGGDAHAHAHPLSEPLHADTDEPICPGGHLHVYLDDVMTNPLVMIEATEFPIALPHDVTEGDHTLIARLQNHDHTIVKPEVTAEASITIVVP